MNAIKELKVKGGNFVASISGTINAAKLADLLESAISYEAERGGWSKVFKGVKDRKAVAYSAEAAAVVDGKLRGHLASFFDNGSLVVNVSAREWSEGAGGKQALAQKTYDDMLGLGIDAEKALAIAKGIHATFAPGKVEEVKLVAETEKAEEPQVEA